MIGEVIGTWTVIEAAPRKWAHTYWQCRCECGSIKDIRQTFLKYKCHIRCEDCYRKPSKMDYIIGKRFGNRVVLSKDQSKIHLLHAYYICKCDCGSIDSIQSYGLIIGKNLRCTKCARKSTRGDNHHKRKKLLDERRSTSST